MENQENFKIRTVFMGTPEFSVESLKYLYDNTQLLFAITKEDKINKRGNAVEFSEVKKFCIENNIKCIQPKTIRGEDIKQLLIESEVDLIVVAAYGKIIPKDVIDIPKYGIINVHSSLLPKYRGASPIHNALLNGDTKTGITIMNIDEGLDTGDMLHKVEIDIEEKDNLETLTKKLSKLSYNALAYTIPKIIDQSIEKVPQDHSLATIVSTIPKEKYKIDFTKNAEDIKNLVRGVYPNAYLTISNKRVKILDVEVIKESYDTVGVVENLTKIGPVISCSDYSIRILKAKFEGKKEQIGIDLVNGRKFNLKEVCNDE